MRRAKHELEAAPAMRRKVWPGMSQYVRHRGLLASQDWSAVTRLVDDVLALYKARWYNMDLPFTTASAEPRRLPK